MFIFLFFLVFIHFAWATIRHILWKKIYVESAKHSIVEHVRERISHVQIGIVNKRGTL
jgi:hypothetical protein